MSLPFELHHTFAKRLPGMARESRGEQQPAPRLLILNEDLATELGIDPEWLRSPAGIDFLCGRSEDSPAHAMAYAGYQFGQFNPRMGDGRALLLGEIETPDGLRDLHAKGTGPTPYSRPGADGRGTVRSMLREYLFSEAMHALGIPTTRSLAVLSTGRRIQRQVEEEAGILVRVAASHIRIGSFHYAAQTGQLQQLADFTIARHYPGASYKELFTRALDAQIATVAAWQHVGFIHGVMNTDNTTLSGETIDYGPCAFMETYDPDTCFSSIDTRGRYRFGHQPDILGWNFARLAESMLPLFDASPNQAINFAQETINSYHERFAAQLESDFVKRFGISTDVKGQARTNADLRSEYFTELAEKQPDFTLANLELWEKLHGTQPTNPPGGPKNSTVPRIIPRPHNVEEALLDMDAFHEFLDAITRPFAPNAKYETPGNPEGYRTYCGT